jgi:serine/threonine protein kinase
MEAKAASFLGKLVGKYRLQEFVGRGLTTAVYRACSEDQQDIPNALVTFLLAPELLSSQALEHFQGRFEREVKQVAALHFPALLPISDYGELEGYPYIIVPAMQGETLATHLKQHRRFLPMQALSILLPITAALSFLSEQGLFFQFLDPSQVLVLENGDALLIGLSLPQLLRLSGLEEEKGADDAHLKSIAGTYLGAPEYLAPEVVRGAAPDIRSAVYTLGVILFEMFGGRPPFTGQHYMEIARKHLTAPLPSLHALSPEVPLALELVVNHALQRNIDQRFQTPTDLLNAYIHMLDILEKRSRSFHTLSLARAIEQDQPARTEPADASPLPAPPSSQGAERKPEQVAETPSELNVIDPGPLSRPHKKIAVSDGLTPPP